MSTTVVNVKRQSCDVYIGRAWSGPGAIGGPWPESPWGNPFHIPRDGNRDEVIAKYEDSLRERLATEPGLWDALMQLEGKVLGCWCKRPDREVACHGDVLVKLIDERRADLSETRHAFAVAEVLANEVFMLLEPNCARIQIAGSIRRNKPMVKDIEIVAIPNVTHVATDLFGNATESVDQLHLYLSLARSAGTFTDRLDKNGRAAFGMKYKRLVYRGIGLDVFSVTPETWAVQLAIRTGSAEFSHRFMTPRRFGGNLPDHMIVRDGTLYRHPDGRSLPMDREERRRLRVDGLEAVPTPTEMDFFAALGMPWVEPEDR